MTVIGCAFAFASFLVVAYLAETIDKGTLR